MLYVNDRVTIYILTPILINQFNQINYASPYFSMISPMISFPNFLTHRKIWVKLLRSRHGSRVGRWGLHPPERLRCLYHQNKTQSELGKCHSHSDCEKWNFLFHWVQKIQNKILTKWKLNKMLILLATYFYITNKLKQCSILPHFRELQNLCIN